VTASPTAHTPAHTRWTTPAVLRALLAAAVAGAALLFAVGLRALNDDRAALRGLREDTAPSIVTAQELGAQLADLDAQLAASMLGGAADRDVAAELFALRRSAAARRLTDAANNVTIGDADRIPVVVMNEELGRYLELAARAQWLYEGGDRDGALTELRVATDLMHERILPQAGALDRVKRDLMDVQYAAAQRASRGYEVEAVLAGMLLVVVLLGAQLFIRRRMRRRFAPALLLATAMTVGFSAYLTGRFRAAREDLRVARDDAFNSIHLLWRARALAYDAKGDEGRWLLDRARGGPYESAFQVKVTQLVSDPRPRALSANARGMLVDELQNITFTGEREAAEAAVAALSDFMGADDRLRRLETQGKHADSVQLAIGAGPYEARAFFDRLDAALVRTTEINQDAFDSVLRLADLGLRRAEWLDPGLALLIAAASWLGVRGRLREYSA
jgi:hypothetical protein